MSHFLAFFESLIEDSIKRFDWIEVLEHIALIPDISSVDLLSFLFGKSVIQLLFFLIANILLSTSTFTLYEFVP